MSDSQLQVLALSGGGYRGLYTAKILADLEQELGAPIASKFDLIAGTSIGGILALALAQEIPASRLVNMFVKDGKRIFKRQWSPFGLFRSQYDSEPLRELLAAEDLFGARSLGSCRHRVIVPAINYSTGKPQIFKTPHHPNLKRDHLHSLVDIALATSAAPIYFRRHVFDNNQYVDGGLYANAPGLLAVHESEHFLATPAHRVRLLSIGTMSSVFTVNPDRNRAGGMWDWGGFWPTKTPKRLFGLSISVQESLTDFMLRQKLGDRYAHIDDVLTPDRACAVALDKTDAGAQEVLLGSASEKSKACLGNSNVMSFFRHQPAPPTFFYGENVKTQ